MKTIQFFLFVFSLLTLLCCEVTKAKVFLTLDNALKAAFPASQGCEVKTENRYLTEEQLRTARKLAGTDIPSALIVRYLGMCKQKTVEIAYTDSHRVRTHPETLFLVVSSGQDGAGAVNRIEVLAFDEPLDYIPRSGWYGKFQGLSLDSDLDVKRKIPFVTGASLTTRATVQAVRRVLAVDQVLRQNSK